jgi:predicted pyridoxine 5'-phosphate oxidase superfamily flavin-nucleotide-binding protein
MTDMAVIDDDMRAIIARSGIGYAATVTADGGPNLSPKGSLAVWDETHLYFADIASPQTIANLRMNPHIEVNFVDVIARRGYRFKGTAEVFEDGPVFEKAREVLTTTHGPQYPCNHAVLIRVESIATLLSPAYMFNDPPPSEDQMRAVWMRRLGMQPLDSDVSSTQIEAYEKILAQLLGLRNAAEVRESFRHKVVQQAADRFEAALANVRSGGRPDEFALADAVEEALANAVAEDLDVDLRQLFDDLDLHEMPSDEITQKVTAAWEQRS